MKSIRSTIFTFFISSVAVFGQDDFSKAKNPFPKNQNLYTAQMHIHGYSNHNGSSQPGSLQWHTKFADSTKTDIIWWTDHRAVFNQEYTFSFDFTNGVYDNINNVITGLSGNEIIPTKWIGDKNSGIVKATLSADTILFELKDVNSSQNFIYSSFVPRGTKGLLKGVQRLVRPLTSKPIFSFNLSSTDFSTYNDNKIIFEVSLSFHLYGQPVQQKLIYNFVNANIYPLSYELLDSSNLIVNYPIHEGNNFIELDIENDAKKLKDGKDNVIQDVKLMLKTKENKTISAKFSQITLVSSTPQDSTNYRKMFNYINEYKNSYGVKQIIGTEVTIDNKESTHLNGFLPDTPDQSSMYVDVAELDFPEIVVPEIHAAGGLVSLNHPFGAKFSIDYDTQEFRTDTMAEYLLNNQAFGVDILEVGYLRRGGVDIDYHLKLWDILTANKLYLYGNGVSDLHGGNWITTNVNFVSYIWAPDYSATSLINSLKLGRFYFGDERLYKGRFYFKVGNTLMGARTLASSLMAPLKIEIENIPQNAYFKLTQGLIQPGLVVNYLYKDSVIDWQNPPCLDISQPNFVRVAMYIGDDPIFFSNPIVFKGVKSNPISNLCPPPQINSPKAPVDKGIFSLFPSSTKSELNVEMKLTEKENYKISVLDNLGKYVAYLGEFKFSEGENLKTFSNLDLAQGGYMLLIENQKFRKTLPFNIVQ